MTLRSPVRPIPSKPSPQALERFAHQVEELDAADGVGEAAPGRRPRRARARAACRDLLTGRWLGHAVHPVLTDLPIGFWTSAFTLDLIGGRRSRAAAQRLVGLGVLSVAAHRRERRGGLVRHDRRGATGRARARRAQHRGHRVLHRVVARAPARPTRTRRALRARGQRGRDRRRLLRRPPGAADRASASTTPPSTSCPAEWTPTRSGKRVDRRRASTRRPSTGRRSSSCATTGDWYGLAARCSHAGGPLDEGDGRATAASSARGTAAGSGLRDGIVAPGPAFAPQPVVDVRVRDDIVEVESRRGALIDASAASDGRCGGLPRDA